MERSEEFLRYIEHMLNHFVAHEADGTGAGVPIKYRLYLPPTIDHWTILQRDLGRMTKHITASTVPPIFLRSLLCWGVAGILSAPTLSAQAGPLEISMGLVRAVPAVPTAVPQALILPTLRRGHKGMAVQALSGLLEYYGADGLPADSRAVFGIEHEAAVKELQNRLGLIADGVAGPILYANLATDPAQRIAAVESWAARLEYLAYFARSEGHRKMVIVNIPSYSLRAIDLDSGRTVVESRVIVGRRDRQTPLGRMDIVALKFSPDWTVPPVVIRHDILPRLGGDPVWFDKRGLVAISPTGETKPASQVTRDEIAGGWRFRQPAEHGSVLGKLKFETDSKAGIYLHDTNEPALFGHASRMKSSGCIRVEKWAELAAFLADTDSESIRRKVADKRTHTEKVERLPVFVEYSRGDVIRGGILMFPDIYGIGSSAPAPNGPLTAGPLPAWSPQLAGQ